jgi:transposase
MPTELTPHLFVALELSRRSWVVAFRVEGRTKISRHRVTGGDLPELMRLIGKYCVNGGKVLVGFEIGYDGFWLHRALTQEGLECWVVDPTSFQVERRAKHRKTDQLDVVAILTAVEAKHGGRNEACRLVRVPSIEEEDAKRLHRERTRLRREKNQHVNRIKALLATQGIYDFDPMRGHKAERFDALRTGDGRVLPPALLAELIREVERLNVTREQLQVVEKIRNDTLVSESDDKVVVIAQRLHQLHGIGAETATVLAREAFYRQFDNRRQLASFAGLTPTPYASGSRQREQGISKAGNVWVRNLCVELAWLWLRNQPQSQLAQWYRERAHIGSGARKVGIVALARKLLIALWRFVESGLVPDGARLRTA